MKKKWITMGLNGSEIKKIDTFINDKNIDIMSYINDFHFPHYDSDELPTGRVPESFTKFDSEKMIDLCSEYRIKKTLILNYGDYKYKDLQRILEEFYLPKGLNSIVLSDKEIASKIRDEYKEIEIQGSCLSYSDSIELLKEEKEHGITLHNPAVWTIRDRVLIENIHKEGLRQKHMFNEGCARKCKLEPWHRKHVSNGINLSLEETCGKSIDSIYTFLQGSWVTLKQLKRMEKYIDILKIPRNTFDNINDLPKLIERYDSGEPYNILEYIATPLLQIKYENTIMSDIFDDAFFDNTVDSEINYEFLNEYVKKLDNIPFFTRK